MSARTLLALERKLARRIDLEELISEDFVEIGSSGTVYDKRQALAAIAAEPPRRISIEGFAIRRLATDVALATYRAAGSARSSIWVRAAHGGWRIVFHQGTPSRRG